MPKISRRWATCCHVLMFRNMPMTIKHSTTLQQIWCCLAEKIHRRDNNNGDDGDDDDEHGDDIIHGFLRDIVVSTTMLKTWNPFISPLTTTTTTTTTSAAVVPSIYCRTLFHTILWHMVMRLKFIVWKQGFVFQDKLQSKFTWERPSKNSFFVVPKTR